MRTMRSLKSYIYSAATMAFTMGLLGSCNAETPFNTDQEGSVRLNVDINSKITRAISEDENAKLRENCVIYISDEQGLIHKWQGLDNVPGQIFLKYGSYVAEAWAGDSVTVSLDKKFYKGMKAFDVNPAESPTTQVTLTCTLANVVSSVDISTIDWDIIDDLSVKFYNTKGSYTLSKEELAEKVYFMMPNNDTELKYTVSLTDKSGDNSTKSGIIYDVESGHEYRLSFTIGDADSIGGLSDIEIIVNEFEDEYNDELVIYGAPVFGWENGSISVGDQIVGDAGSFEDNSLRIAVYDDFYSVTISPKDEKSKNAINGYNEIELIHMSNNQKAQLENLGIVVTTNKKEELTRMTINFTEKWLNNLPLNENEYCYFITATDKRNGVAGKSSTAKVRIANTQEAIEYELITIDPEFANNDFTAVGTYSARIPVTVNNELESPLIQYRKQGTEDWNSKPIVLSRANVTTTEVIIDGLTPATIYEFRSVGGQVSDTGEYEFETSIATFKTEGKFEIPNASMEEWSSLSTNSKVLLPSAGGSTSFWDTGNHGSATLNVTLTQSSTDMVNSGQYSARLRSQYVSLIGIGKFAAGNLFVGQYKGTQGTDGIIEFGRPYDGSHPKAVKVMANYRPGKVEKSKDGQNYLKVGDTDYGQIYVALTTSTVTVNTADQSTLFNPNSKNVIAYGEVTWHENFGPDNQLEEILINFDYKESAKDTKPTHLIIVCSASKYGDYFVGGEGSLMYLDDFELVY